MTQSIIIKKEFSDAKNRLFGNEKIIKDAFKFSIKYSLLVEEFIHRVLVGKKKTFVGYIELTMPLMMVAPRHRTFARPFKHSSRDIQWEKWDQTCGSGTEHNPMSFPTIRFPSYSHGQ